MATQETRNGVTFKAWYAQVNRICIDLAGLGIDDLADGPSYDMWDSEVSPRDYVIERLEEEGFPMEALS